jgi:hypothetical protein
VPGCMHVRAYVFVRACELARACAHVDLLIQEAKCLHLYYVVICGFCGSTIIVDII